MEYCNPNLVSLVIPASPDSVDTGLLTTPFPISPFVHFRLLISPICLQPVASLTTELLALEVRLWVYGG